MRPYLWVLSFIQIETYIGSDANQIMTVFSKHIRSTYTSFRSLNLRQYLSLYNRSSIVYPHNIYLPSFTCSHRQWLDEQEKKEKKRIKHLWQRRYFEIWERVYYSKHLLYYATIVKRLFKKRKLLYLATPIERNWKCSLMKEFLLCHVTIYMF